MTNWLLLALATVLVAGAVLLKLKRPAWYWMTFGLPVAIVRVLVSYGQVTEACGLTVAPARWHLALARMLNRPAPGPRSPRIRGVRPTRTGMVLKVRLRSGQDAVDVAASTDRLRHSFRMQGVTSREIRAGLVEIRMTGYDVLKRVQMPAEVDAAPMRIPVALRENGAVHYRDYRSTPHGLTIGATQSGKSVYQRNLIVELAPRRVALVGIDCKNGVELYPLARRFSALADNSDTAVDLLEALVARMQSTYELIRREQRIGADTEDADIAADIWDLPESLRPVPIVLIIDEVAELALHAGKAEEKRRDRIITALIRIAQLGRAAGLYLEVCGQRFGSELGNGITMLRAQLSNRTAHRVNDESSAKMAFGDIAPDAVLAALQISSDEPGMAVSADASGGWHRVRTPYRSLRNAVNTCNKLAHLTPELPELARFRPLVDLTKAPTAKAVTTAA